MECVTLSDTEFVSLAELLFQRGVSVGSLATEVEDSGVHGWDRFGRFKRFAPEDGEALRVLDRLALHYDKVSHSERYAEDSGIPDPESDLLYYFGWAVDRLPSFVEGEAVRKPQRPQSAAREENSALRLVEALRRLALGDLTGNRHPDCPDEDALISEIVNHAIGRDGLKGATVKKKFKAAAELWSID